MYNYFMICGNVKCIEGNVLTVTSYREFKNADGTRTTDEFKFELLGALASDDLKEKLKEGIPLGVKGRIEPSGDKYILIAERLIFPQDFRPIKNE